jgi:hypothetical protein
VGKADEEEELVVSSQGVRNKRLRGKDIEDRHRINRNAAS